MNPLILLNIVAVIPELCVVAIWPAVLEVAFLSKSCNFFKNLVFIQELKLFWRLKDLCSVGLLSSRMTRIEMMTFLLNIIWKEKYKLNYFSHTLSWTTFKCLYTSAAAVNSLITRLQKNCTFPKWSFKLQAC